MFQCFELGENSLILDFAPLLFLENNIYSTFMCNFFKFFSNFSLKKVVIKKFCPLNDEFKAFISFLAGNRSSLVHLEFEGSYFDECHQNVRKLFFPNLQNIVFDMCSYIGKLGIQIGPKLVSFKSTFGHLYFDTGNGVCTGISSLPR